jgi:AcrR family transcriptional regulator
MARTIKEEDYLTRRNEILEAAQRLIYTKGYDQMTIQDILDAIGISKGAFYHYFSSKPALLEALIERMLNNAVQVIRPVVEDPNLPALEKLQRFFGDTARWKTGQKSFFLGVMRSWYADENALVRQKVMAAGMRRVSPFYSAIIEQGVREGVFSVPCSDRAAEVVLVLGQGMSDRLAGQFLSAQPVSLENLEETLAVYVDAVERILGAPRGSIRVMDRDTLKEWMAVTEVNEAAI